MTKVWERCWSIRSFKKNYCGRGDGSSIKVLAAMAEHLGSIPSAHMAPDNPSFGSVLKTLKLTTEESLYWFCTFSLTC